MENPNQSAQPAVPTKPPAQQAEKQRKLALALRRNLQRRKASAHSRKAGADR